MKNLFLILIVLILTSCSDGLPDYSKVEPVTQEELAEINKNAWSEIKVPMDSLRNILTDKELLFLCCQEFEIKYQEVIKGIQDNRPISMKAFLVNDIRFVQICDQVGLDPSLLPSSYFGDETTGNK